MLASAQDNEPNPEVRQALRSSYERTREIAVDVFTEMARSVPAYTEHGVAHVDALWQQLDQVVGHPSINPAEAYVLACALLLHDIAMGLLLGEDIVEAFGRDRWSDLVAVTFFEVNGRWPIASEIEKPPDDVLDACRSRAIRNTHAARGAKLVEKGWQLQDGSYQYLIEDSRLRAGFGPTIGKLVASHWWGVEELPLRFPRPIGVPVGLPREWQIDTLKLACMLRVADATQIDGSRAPVLLFALRTPRGEARKHWRFQMYMSPSWLDGDRLIYRSLRSFRREDADAWWLAREYLQSVDRELHKVDSLLRDLKRPQFAARGVARVDGPERFAELFEVEGWQPIDAEVQISNVRTHIAALGGEQLYGSRTPEAALRELIQNAQDAVCARRVVDRYLGAGQIIVGLERTGDDWFLTVRDDGTGMDEEIIRRCLLDFGGGSGWWTEVIRSTFPGLFSRGFRPVGTFGVGFYSVFMLGDDVSVTSRRYDLAHHDARHLEFNEGLTTRPMMCPVPDQPIAGPGTVVRVRLKSHPLNGLLARTRNEELIELVERLVVSHSVPIVVEEGTADRPQSQTLQPFDLATASPEDVFDRLYSSRSGFSKSRGHHTALRDEFCAQATPLIDDEGRRRGLAVLGQHLIMQHGEMYGTVVLGGFRAGDNDDFTGYFEGLASRASRDNVQLGCTSDQLAKWILSQEQRLRERGLFTASSQLELAEILHRAAGGTLADDHHIGLIGDGLITVGGIDAWAADREQVWLSFGVPCQWETRPPGLWHRLTGQEVTPLVGRLVLGPPSPFAFFDDKLPAPRDPAYAEHRSDQESTWQQIWWRESGQILGLVIKRMCRAWSCDVEQLLAPIVDREGWWTEREDLGLGNGVQVPVLRLDRPG